MRCKHCGLIVQGRPRVSEPAFPGLPHGTQVAIATAPELPAAVAEGDFSFGPAGTLANAARRPRSRGAGGLLKALVVLTCVAGFIGTVGYFIWTETQRNQEEQGGGESSTFAKAPVERKTTGLSKSSQGSIEKTGTGSREVPIDAVFPRRALVIGVSNYVYANPISYLVGNGEASHHPLAKIGALLRIHSDQMVEVSDASRGAQAVPPLKTVIEQTVQEFVEGCRAQDRVLLAFSGHAVVLDDVPYLVPLEGELTVKETLLPLSWLLDQVGKCKARQKVLILDVCRFNQGRGLERPGSGPLHEKFAAMLENPPDGVQVWTACSPGQESLEGENGSVFFQTMEKVLAPLVGKRIQKPDEPLPIAALVPLVKDEIDLSSKQAPRLTGKELESGAAYDPAEKVPPRLVVKLPTFGGDVAARAEVLSILDELDVPAVKPPRAHTPPLRLETLIPFSPQTLEQYKADYKDLKEIKEQPQKYPVRVAVLEAAEALRTHGSVSLIDYVGAGSNGEAAKKSILAQQREPARIYQDLKEKVEALRELAEMKGEETKRWQAHYDYILAQTLARMAYVHEYNLMQGKIRKDDLPPLEQFHIGHRLASRERLQSDQEVRGLAAESKKLLQQIAKKYAGTPWEILAKRERFTALGLEWQPARN